MEMTLLEMQTRYPNKWLGLTNVKKDESRHLVSAEVVFTDKTASELGMMSLQGQDIVPFFTTPDKTFHVGALM